MSKSRQLTYSQALSELEQIVSEMEAEDVDVDRISEKVKRATALIAFCRNRLRTTEEEVSSILAETESSPEGRGGQRADDAPETGDPEDSDVGLDTEP